MRKIVLFAIICLLIHVAGCSQTTESMLETSDRVDHERSTSLEAPDVVDGYLLVIDHLITYGSGLSNRDKYLAIDTTKMVNLTPDDVIRLVKSLEKYNLQILNKPLDELEKEGFLQGHRMKDGLLIIIEDTKMESNSITMNASRYREALNAYGLQDFRIRFVSGQWEMADINITWVE